MAASSSIMITSGFSASRVCVETGGSDLRKSARSTVISSLFSFIAQCLGDRRKQRLSVERFAKDPAYSLSPRMIRNLMAPGDQENRQLSMRHPDDPEEFEAAVPGSRQGCGVGRRRAGRVDLGGR